MTCFARLKDVFARTYLCGEVTQVDLQAATLPLPCVSSIRVRAFWTGLATTVQSYYIDGILFFNERNGPLLEPWEQATPSGIASSRVTCLLLPPKGRP